MKHDILMSTTNEWSMRRNCTPWGYRHICMTIVGLWGAPLSTKDSLQQMNDQSDEIATHGDTDTDVWE